MADPIEIWGGAECTVNRVGNRYFDQIERSGHARRLDDLDRFAALGITAIRYAVHWERAPDWAWADERLERLRELGLRPILGLVHHGSGPPHTNLLDPAFPARLALHAREVAGRYPWVEDWTPVNEPLTTARFSCLYGHWYPHARDAGAFARALVNQCRAVVLAMRAIRETIPHARLVQTDDLGKTHATPALQYQADHENERRWLTWDLLCGRENGVRDWLLAAGIGASELEWFRENPCPPEIVGVNHYLSSERFLDHRVALYDDSLVGGNGRHAYADVLALRVRATGADGPTALLREAWERYGLPIAVTEAHNGCTREEQLRWLDEIWRGANELRNEGVDVRAVTVWSLLGAYDWDQMVTSGRGHYEPGVFDLRGPKPRRTALAHMTRALARTGSYYHPVLGAPGWWNRHERVWYPPPDGEVERARDVRTRPILVTGGTGTLGRAFARACAARGLVHRLTVRGELDIGDDDSVAEALDEIWPWAVINAAGYVRVDDAEDDEGRCRRENVDGPTRLGAHCAVRGIQLATFSSDLVFDGTKHAPYVESDPVAPLGAYGRSKADAETLVLEALPSALVVRTSAFYGPWDEHNFVTLALMALSAGQSFGASDEIVSPTYVPDLCDAVLDLLIDGERGIWHVAGPDAVSWLELARAAARHDGVDPKRLRVATPAARAPRPRYSALCSERGLLLPALNDALARYVSERRAYAATRAAPA